MFTFVREIINHNKQKCLHFCLIAICAACAFSSCDQKKEENPLLQLDENDFTGVKKYFGDSIPSSNISRECAMVCHKIDKVAKEAAFVNNPSSLIEIKKQYLEELAQASSNISQLSDEEKAIAIEHKNEAEESYTKACRNYEVPASGVLANLKNLIDRIDKVSTKDELMRFQDCRIGMLNDLDHIYLCVESRSNAIPEVKRLAQVLKNKYEKKKQQFGLQ